MRLQVKKLDGPGEIRLTSNAQTSYPTTVGANDATDRFTCYFNRAITNEDTFPQIVTVKVYNREGVEQITIPLSVNRNIVNEADTANANFCFTLTLNCPETMSGSHFYVHAVLLNADVNAQNVSYTVSLYHQTIKKVYIYADKSFEQVYWSSNEQITYEEETATEESLRTGSIGQNEDAFLHIKTLGMYEDQVVLLLSANDGAVELRREAISMKQNRRVVAFDMAETIQRYRQQTNTLTGDVSFTLKATLTIPNQGGENTTVSVTNTNNENTTSERGWGETILVTLAQIITAPLWILSGCTPTNKESTTSTEVATPQVNPSNIIQSSTQLLSVTSTDATPATKRTSTGTVYVNVNTGETPDIIPTRFRDFKIGCLIHLEGIGRTRAVNNNAQDGTYHTVYPLNVYEIMLSDLVACGLVTIDEAIYLTTTNHDLTNLRTRDNLQSTFNKLTASLSATKQLIHVFQDRTNTTVAHRNRINKSATRKILAQIRHKDSIWTENDGQEMCRDGWQLISAGYRSDGLKEVFPRTQNGRYNTNKECPPGEYFVNWVLGATYRVFVAQEPTGSTIYTYPGRGVGDANRGAIAFHRGGAKAAVGCITFNLSYSGGNYTAFNNIIFEAKSGSQNNTHWLNLLCMDERNAIQEQNDTNTVVRNPEQRRHTHRGSNPITHTDEHSVTQNFWRWYDLATPK